MQLKLDKVAMGTDVLSINVPDFLREKLATGIKYFDDVIGKKTRKKITRGKAVNFKDFN